MKTYLITQYQNEMPSVLEFNNENEMKKYLGALGNIIAVAINYNVFYVKVRENKVDKYEDNQE